MVEQFLRTSWTPERKKERKKKSVIPAQKRWVRMRWIKRHKQRLPLWGVLLKGEKEERCQKTQGKKKKKRETKSQLGSTAKEKVKTVTGLHGGTTGSHGRDVAARNRGQTEKKKKGNDGFTRRGPNKTDFTPIRTTEDHNRPIPMQQRKGGLGGRRAARKEKVPGEVS